MRKPHLVCLICLLLVSAPLSETTQAADQPFYLGGDISSLSESEKAGAVYRDHGKAGDCITILHDHGCALFRLRLFVNPEHDFDQASGATQDLRMVLALSTRIKKAGGKISLALQYSDTWADPGKQFKPAAWKDLPMDQLQKKVTDYTVEVMKAMKANGTVPDIVEVGNETRTGMLWPEGKLDGKTQAEKDAKWDSYVALMNAGISGVRSQSPADQTRVLIHVDSGGRNPPPWFFGELKKHQADYDIIGLSFYPSWKDSIDKLKSNLAELAPLGKDILIIEAGYPYKPIRQTPQMQWPMTPAGQKQFLDDLISTVKEAPDHHGIGVVWWYPEAMPIAAHKTWQGGALGWFDETGDLLPILRDR